MIAKCKLIDMTDNRFRMICVCATIAVVAIAGMIIFSPKKDAAKPHRGPSIGKYVYVDQLNTVHTNRKCSRLNYKGMHSERIKVEDFVFYEYCSYCPKCVTDEDYQTLEQGLQHTATGKNI